MVSFGPFRLFPAERLLDRDGVPVKLGGRALDILLTLVRNAGDVVSKADLLSRVWPDTVVVQSSLGSTSPVCRAGPSVFAA